jgi:hypothetical protein
MGEQRERRLISEWRAEKYPKDQHILGCPLGAIQAELTAKIGLHRAIKASRPWRLEADAVVITSGRLILAEAKVFRPRDGIGDLLCYKGVVAATPELQPYLDRPLELVLVIPWATALVEDMCKASGIRLDIFNPLWVADFIESMHKYWTPEYQAARAEKKRLRQALGVE